MKSFTLGCFLGVILILLGMLFEAHSAPATDKPSQAKKPKAELTARSVKFDTGRKDAKGKEVTREFPVMFDIAARSRKATEEKRAAKSPGTKAPTR